MNPLITGFSEAIRALEPHQRVGVADGWHRALRREHNQDRGYNRSIFPAHSAVIESWRPGYPHGWLGPHNCGRGNEPRVDRLGPEHAAARKFIRRWLAVFS